MICLDLSGNRVSHRYGLNIKEQEAFPTVLKRSISTQWGQLHRDKIISRKYIQIVRNKTRNMHAMKVTRLYSKNLLKRHLHIHYLQDRIIFKQCKLFCSNSVVNNKSTVTFENILSDENKVRIQNKLKKYEDPVIRKVTVSDNHKKAAVLVPLCTVNGQPSLLFMVRSNLIPAHRGEISFPGGMMDDTDQDLITTALRETQEEIGLEIPREAVWGSLQSLPSRNGETLVTPIVASVGELQENQLRLNKDEVESIFTRKISSLCDSKNVGSTQFRRGKLPSLKSGYTLPVYLGGEHRIWGLTAIVLHMFLPVLAPGLYKFKLRHRH